MKFKKYIPQLLHKGILGLSLCVIAASSAEAQTQLSISQLLGQRNVITTAVPFLGITPDARAGGMGDVGVATSTDANSLHWNPAKLAFADADKPFGMSVSYTPWLAALVPDISLSYISGYYRIDKLSAFGFGMRYFSLGDITFTDNQGFELKTYRPNEFSFDLAYSRKLDDHFSIGVAGRVLRSDLSGKTSIGGTTTTKPAVGFGGDISGMYQKKDIKVKDMKADFGFGFNISNIGPKVTYTNEASRDFIPINLRLGASYNLHIDKYNEIMVAFDINKLLVPTNPRYKLDSAGSRIPSSTPGEYELDYGKQPKVPVIQGMIQSFYDAPGGLKEELREINPSLGIEYWYDKQFAVRTGYFYEHPTKGNRQYLTVGLGVKYNVFQFDFSYLVTTNGQKTISKNPLENTLRFSLLFYFNKKKGGGLDTKGAE